MELFECVRLRATISERQCGINRNGYHNPRGGVKLAPLATCQGCAGLGRAAHVALPVEEIDVKKTLKHIYCGHKGCYTIVKKQGDYCKRHQGLEDQVAAGTVQSDPSEEKRDMVNPPPEGDGVAESESSVPQRGLKEIDAASICAVCVGDCNAGPTPCQPGALSDCVNFVPWRRDDERTQAMLSLVGLAMSLEILAQQTDQDVMSAEFYAGALHLQASDNEDVQVPSMPFFLKGSQTCAPLEVDHVADAGKLIDAETDDTETVREEVKGWVRESLEELGEQPGPEFEISPVAPHPPQEQADPLDLPSSPATEGTKGLAALLRAPAPPPVGLFIPFALEELAALSESEVTPDIIRAFVIMGLEGKLQSVADAAA